MKQKFLKIAVVLMLIMTLTMANFVLLCVNAVSYAAQVINMEKSTNNKNVEFMMYFKNDKGEKVDAHDANINSDNLKLYFQISVKQEGYFNGNIILNNSNFRFKTDITSDSVNKIENNNIYLNQINAGETKEIEVNIELISEENIELSLLTQKSNVTLDGVYRDSKQKDIAINAKRNVSLNIISPYANSDEVLNLSQEVITNKVFNYNGEDKRIVQVQIKSGLINNLFPIKTSSIYVQAPKISNKYPESVFVNSNETLATNGKGLTQNNWSYNSQTGTITINIENEEDNNKISWIKNGEDDFLITYIFDKDVKFEDNLFNVESKITLYDNSVYEANNNIKINNEEKDKIVASNIKQNEASIYKGKLYAGISRDVIYTNYIDINLTNVVNEFIVKEDIQTINDQKLNAVYNNTKIDKTKLMNVLGDKGTLYLLDSVTGNLISSINKDTETDENGQIIVNYPDNIQSINIKVISPENVGKIEISTTKTIVKNNEQVLKNSDAINMNVLTSYVYNNQEVQIENIESNVELKETDTSFDFNINRTELSAMTTNSNVEFRIVLNSNNESNKLYENPVLRLKIPNKIENIKVNSINLLYEDEMKIESAKLLDNNILEIKLKGIQTKYKDEAIEGAIIIINADLTTNRKTTSSTEQFVLNLNNGKEQKQIQKDMNIVSYVGLVTVNRISDYGIEVVNNEGNKLGTLELAQKQKTVKVENEIINNEENQIDNIKILGTFPTKDAIDGNNLENSIVNGISVLGIEQNRIKIYYTENADATEDINVKNNNWEETINDIKNVKKYLVCVDKLDVAESIELSYDVMIPGDLEYNLSSKEGYEVYYTNKTISKKIELDDVTLATPKGATIETTLKALVAGEEKNEVKENEVLRYEATISNVGSEDISDIKLLANVPDGTSLVNSNSSNQEEIKFVDDETKNLELSIDNLAQGQTITKYYEVKVKEGTKNNEISNAVETKYGEASKMSNEVKTEVEKGNIELQLISVDAENEVLKSGYAYRYVLNVINHSNNDVKNAKITIKKDDLLNISEIYYVDSDNKVISEKNKNEITIEKIGAGETVEVAISTDVQLFKGNESKNISMVAYCNLNGNTYNSNEITAVAKSDLTLDISVNSENNNSYVKADDVIKYNINVKNSGKEDVKNVTLSNWVSNNVTVTKVIRNNKELSNEEYTLKTDNIKGQKVLIINEEELKAGESVEYSIEVIVNLVFGNKEAIEIVNKDTISVDSFEVSSIETKHILEPEKIENDGQDDNSNNNNNNNNNNNSNSNTGSDSSKYKIISGTVWLDENENGVKDTNEQTLEGVTVKLLNVENNEFVKDLNGNELSSITNSTGFYNFPNVPSGEYIVIFEYDTSKYSLTLYQKDGVSDIENSNVITKTIKINDEEKNVAATEILKVSSNNIANINMGLINAKKYDLQLDKYVSKVTVQNNKTVSKTYTNTTLAKEEIDAKQVNSTTVIVEYTITVTNKGDVAGYVRKIADYLSVDYKFSSELNKDWYQSGNDVYCTSLANEKIEPGESKSVTLTVIKTMSENNTGLINNTAEIVDSYNEYGLADSNSTEGNKVKGENDMGSADLIISIKTGQVVMTVSLVITTIVIIGIAIYVIKRLFINGKII